MSQVVKLMFVQFLISAASWTRILEDLTHHLEWYMRFELTGQEWWPRAKQQAFLATAQLQHTCPIGRSLIQISFPQKHTVLHNNERDIIKKQWAFKGMLIAFVSLNYSIQNVHVILCIFCFCSSFSFWIIVVFWLTGCIAITFCFTFYLPFLLNSVH